MNLLGEDSDYGTLYGTETHRPTNWVPSGGMPSDPAVAAAEMQRLLTSGPRTTFDPAWFQFSGHQLEPGAIVEALRPHLTEHRLERIDEVLADRTYNLAVVVEGLVDSGNVSAIMRTTDGFGVQPFHAIDTAASYKHSRRTSQGAEKWLDRYRWRSVGECLSFVRRAGYRIVAGHPAVASSDVSDVDFSTPTALVLGNELAGLSAEMLAAADETIAIPLGGFVRSFNISVAAALCLYEARRDRIARLGAHGDLSDVDRDRLRAVFAMKSVRHHRELIERALAQSGSGIIGS